MSDQEHEERSEETSEESEKDVAEEEMKPDVLSDYKTEGGASE